uniref:NADH-ubiquinone oxidoreductase chain 2 n=1 Tax=Karaftohelix adamsi TaxID=2013957 RepID=A0A8J9R7I6_9EUPU|nr:NADH dehydrogenase subunit 2 [Karaftohelix adamsi]
MSLWLSLMGFFGALLVGLLTSNWLALVFIMEFTLFMFLFLMYEHNSLSLSPSSIKYFFAQTVGSLCLFISGLYLTIYLSMSNPIVILVLIVGLCLKIGLFPFHFWVMPVMSGLPYTMLGLLGIPMKILPLSLLASSSLVLSQKTVWSFLMLFLSSFSMIVGLLYGLRSVSIRAVLGASSITHGGWFLLASISGDMVMYFVMYSVMLILVVWSLHYHKLYAAGLGLVGMAGLPPFTLFFGKLAVLSAIIQQNIPIGVVVVALLTAVLSLFYYLKFAFCFLLINK